jgi:hypothetical protein
VVQDNVLYGVLFMNALSNNVANIFCNQGRNGVAVSTAPLLDWIKKKMAN